MNSTLFQLFLWIYYCCHFYPSPSVGAVSLK